MFTEENIERDMHKPLWIKLNKKGVEELTENIYHNQDNNNFKIIINKRTDDLKNAKSFWMRLTPRKISKSEAKELYNELTQKDINTLTKGKK